MPTVSEVMTRGVRTLTPEDTLQFAAQAMDELSVGSIPVCDGQRVVGVVTDRDITVRATAHGLPAEDAQLAQIMSREVRCCYEDQSVEEAAQIMCDAQLRRLPVVDRNQRLVGILSLGDVAVRADTDEAAKALQGISIPSRPDRSGLSAAAGSAAGGADAR